MAYLSDIEIFNLRNKGEFKIEPFEPKLVRSICVELRLGNKFTTIMSSGTNYIDPIAGLKEEYVTTQKLSTVEVMDGGSYMISPGEYVIGVTKEKITMPKTHYGSLFGRASMGRLGLQVFCSGGFVDPGFSGYLTLEIFNASKVPIMLRSGMPIAKLTIEELKVVPTVLRPSLTDYERAAEVTLAKADEAEDEAR